MFKVGIGPSSSH
ncbi:hypothetical protein I4I36_25135, partial [Klebsiella pneumoniae]|nr:hypothetical protein [Klebsiella pneumoniae]